MSGDTIQENMPCQGVTLPLDQETMPSDLYQVLSRGLQADYKDRDLDIHQIRHVFQQIRVNQPYHMLKLLARNYMNLGQN